MKHYKAYNKGEVWYAKENVALRQHIAIDEYIKEQNARPQNSPEQRHKKRRDFAMELHKAHTLDIFIIIVK